MRKTLPAHPSLDHLKSQAKDLLDAYKREEPEALERFRDALPAAGGSGATDAQIVAKRLALHDAQSAVAREYGFPSWNDLRAHVEKLAHPAHAAVPTPATNPAELSPEALKALMERHRISPMPAEVQAALVAASAHQSPAVVSIASPLPMIPIRDALLTPGAIAPLHIGRTSSLAALAAAERGDGALVVFTQRKPASEAPREDDLHPIGCTIRLLEVIPTPDDGSWIIVKAARWVHLAALEKTEPFLLARVSDFTVAHEADDEVARLHETLHTKVRAFVAALPNADQLLELVKTMSPLELADATIANLTCPVEEKARYAAQSNLKDRLRSVLALLDAPAT